MYVPLRHWKSAVRRTPGGSGAVKAIVFVSGLLFILLGAVAIVLPGPWTIPPILIGFYIWSTEFAWADRLFDRARRSADEAWENAKRRPITTGIVTVGGLIALGVGIWLATKYDLVGRAKDVVGV